MRARRGVNTSSGASTKKSIIITPADRGRAERTRSYDGSRLERTRPRQRPIERHPRLCRRAALLRKALHWFGRAARARPRDENIARATANAYGWLADSFFNRRLWEPSLAARRQQLRLAERLYRANPASAENNFRYALALRGAGGTLLRVPGPRNRNGARGLLFQAFGWSRRLTRHDPDNTEWQLFRAFMDCELYYDRLGWPPGSARGAARDIRAVDQALRAQRNPRAAEFANCVRHLNDPPVGG